MRTWHSSGNNGTPCSYLNGARSGRCHLYHPEKYPFQLICPVQFLWRPPQVLLVNMKWNSGFESQLYQIVHSLFTHRWNLMPRPSAPPSHCYFFDQRILTSLQKIFIAFIDSDFIKSLGWWESVAVVDDPPICCFRAFQCDRVFIGARWRWFVTHISTQVRYKICKHIPFYIVRRPAILFYQYVVKTI